MSEPLWAVEDVAAYLGVTPEWVRENCREGNIPGFKLTPEGKFWKFRPERVEAWLNDLDEGNRAEVPETSSEPGRWAVNLPRSGPRSTVAACVIAARNLGSSYDAHGLRVGAVIAVPGGCSAKGGWS